jgi:quercetin dioxygenase-like cupin family protein
VVGVTGRVLVREETFFVAQLRFAEHATIHPHAGDRDAIVVCIEGGGFTSVGDQIDALREGQQVRWPKGVVHGLWTEGSTMSTLMIERFD